ncbi:NUDIX domain-containing protein [Solwaraspora sp. WMMB335]|uniref:NUDIX domain-containing protein n=1 Tax=Solwaraspora sp. WMMB335 TaxID=3404118 RepID=UPI003B964FB1
MSSISWADSYLGQLRALAGDRVLLFVGARCVVRDATDRVLLIKRSDNGLWALPAGAMELGESIAGCAAREVYEETGLRAAGVTPFAMHTGADYTFTNMYDHTYQLFVVCFRVDGYGGHLVRETDETTDAGFFAVGSLPAPLAGTVPDTLSDLTAFEHSGQLVLK